jgi:starvation-inducible DNA-binding protein
MSDKNAKNDHIVQEFGSLQPVRIGLSEEVRSKSVRALNRMLAHTMAMRDAYKKAHWQTAGAMFYELHLLFDKHYEEQAELMDSIAERIQTLASRRSPTRRAAASRRAPSWTAWPAATRRC